jgi:hypothetical protein
VGGSADLGLRYPFASELREYFECFESAIGFRSTFSVMISALNGLPLGGGSGNRDPLAELMDHPRIAEGNRVSRTISKLWDTGAGRHAAVLTILYGSKGSVEWSEAFGALAPLAPMTMAVTEARDQLATREGMRREEIVGRSTTEAQAAVREEIEHEFWATATRRSKAIAEHAKLVDRLDALQAQANDGAPLSTRSVTLLGDGDKRLAALERQIAGMDDFLWRLLCAYRADGVARAKVGALAGADREVTTAAAVRSKLIPPRGMDGDAKAAWALARAAFVAQVLHEAGALRRAAHEAYKAARREVAR